MKKVRRSQLAILLLNRVKQFVFPVSIVNQIFLVRKIERMICQNEITPKKLIDYRPVQKLNK